MKNGKRLLTVVTSGFLALSMTIAPLAAGFTNVTAFANPDLGEVGLEKVPDPIDPQSWRLNRDMSWNDFNPNPVLDWREGLNPASLDNKFNNVDLQNRNRKIEGAIILVNYLDREFISSGDIASDPLGYYRYKLDGSGLEDTKTNNPMYSVPKLIAEEKNIPVSEVTDAMFAQWWADFLNKPQELNHGLTVDEYWRENSYGKWGVNLKPHGPYTVPYFEWELGQSYQSNDDIPPSFRLPGSTPGSYASRPDMDTSYYRAANAAGVPFKDYDFFYILHAGYDESGVWQEFGQAQFENRADIPYELGPGPRMSKVEKIFTEQPVLLDRYIGRYPESAIFSDAKALYILKDHPEAALNTGLLDEFVETALRNVTFLKDTLDVYSKYPEKIVTTTEVAAKARTADLITFLETTLPNKLDAIYKGTEPILGDSAKLAALSEIIGEVDKEITDAIGNALWADLLTALNGYPNSGIDYDGYGRNVTPRSELTGYRTTALNELTNAKNYLTAIKKILDTKVIGKTTTADKYEFKLSDADWAWVNGYNNQTAKNTRYVSFTSWEAASGEWSHAGSYTFKGRSIPRSCQGECDGMATFAHEFGHIASISDNYGSPWVDQFSPATEPWDIMSRGSFAGPFGDHARWTVPGVESGSVPVHMMQWNKDALLNYYDDDDLLELNVWDLAAGTPVVTDIVARNIPLANANYPDLAAYGLTKAANGGNYYKGLRLNLGVDKVTNNRFGKLPINGMTEWKDKSVFAGSQSVTSVTINGVSRNSPFILDGVTYPNQVTSGTNNGFTNTLKEAAGFTVEVVDQSGYDSYLTDHGVLIGRFHVNQSNSSHAVIDSHLGDIAMVDYEKGGEYYPYPLAHAMQLADAAFHAGVSTTDTGYYASKYDPSDPNFANEKAIHFNPSTYSMEWKKDMLKPGSIQQWEDRDGRDIVSGNTVNEFYDKANGLHFYILQKNLSDGRKIGNETQQYLSYQVGVLHDNGKPVNGELVVEKGELQPATAGRVAVQEFKITNKGADATDIVRVGIGGTLGYKTTILNNLFAIAPNETITVPVYIEVPETVGFAAASVPTVTLTSLSDADLTLTASSESNAAKTSTATVGDAANQSTVNRLIVTTDKAIVSTNEYFNVNVKFAEKVSSNTAILTYTFDTDKFEYRGLGLAPGVKALNTVVNGGTLKITVMVDDYDTLDYGNVLFSANGNIDLTNKANEILVKVECVVKDANGVKTIKGADGGTVQLTGLQGDTNGDGKVDLIDLSNMIDWYGFNTNTPDWETKYVFYDFNRTGEIDISDVTKVAQLINL